MSTQINLLLMVSVCNCNGRSERCVFDEELYKKTGHGGRCLDCREDTEGVNCEKCQINFYRESANDRCKACNCNPTGNDTCTWALSLICNVAC